MVILIIQLNEWMNPQHIYLLFYLFVLIYSFVFLLYKYNFTWSFSILDNYHQLKITCSICESSYLFIYLFIIDQLIDLCIVNQLTFLFIPVFFIDLWIDLLIHLFIYNCEIRWWLQLRNNTMAITVKYDYGFLNVLPVAIHLTNLFQVVSFLLYIYCIMPCRRACPNKRVPSYLWLKYYQQMSVLKVPILCTHFPFIV